MLSSARVRLHRRDFENSPIRSIACLFAMTAISTASSLAQAELLDIARNASGQYEKTATVQSGKFFELCGGLT